MRHEFSHGENAVAPSSRRFFTKLHSTIQFTEIYPIGGRSWNDQACDGVLGLLPGVSSDEMDSVGLVTNRSGLRMVGRYWFFDQVTGS